MSGVRTSGQGMDSAGGDQGQREEYALDKGLVIAGWEKAGDLTDCESIDDVGDILAKAYPDEPARTVENWKPRGCMRPSYLPRSQRGSGRHSTADPGRKQAVADLGRRATFTLAPEPGRQPRTRFRPAGLDHGNTPTGWWSAYGKRVVSARG